MNPKKNYQLLLNKYLLNECTPAETEELFDHLKKDGAVTRGYPGASPIVRGFTVFYYGEPEVEEITHGLFP